MKKVFTFLALALSTTGFAQITNPGMETWRTYSSGSSSSLTAPTGWNGSDSLVYAFSSLCGCTPQQQIFQCDTPHGGTYAAKIMSTDVGGLFGVLEGALTNAQVNVDIASMTATISGGSPTTSRIDTVSTWIKYAPRSGDSASVDIRAVIAGAGAGGTDSVIGTGQDVSMSSGNYILATPAYTKHSYVISYVTSTIVPDHIQITFHTSYTSQVTDSSTMYVDDVAMHAEPLSSPAFGIVAANCYPNPADNVLNISTANYQNTTAILYNMLGQRVATQPLTGAVTTMNIASLSNGMYYVHLTGTHNEIVYETKFVKQ